MRATIYPLNVYTLNNGQINKKPFEIIAKLRVAPHNLWIKQQKEKMR